jgi:hypothetical protein
VVTIATILGSDAGRDRARAIDDERHTDRAVGLRAGSA